MKTNPSILEKLKKLNEYLETISDEELEVIKHRFNNITKEEIEKAKYYERLEQWLLEKPNE